MTSQSLVPYTTLFFVSLVLCSVRVNFSRDSLQGQVRRILKEVSNFYLCHHDE